MNSLVIADNWIHRIASSTACVCWHERGQWHRLASIDLANHVNGWRQVLRHHGLQSGQRLAFLGTGDPFYLTLMLACLAEGLTACPMDPRLSTHELSRLLAIAKPDALFTGTRALQQNALDAGFVGILLQAIDLAPDNNPLLASADSWPDLHPAFLCFTSGSSGTPKAVLLPWRSLRHQMVQLAARFACEDIGFLSLLPPNHLLELVCGWLTPLALGGKVVLANSLLPDHLIGLLRDEPCTHIIVVPPLLALLLQGFRKYGLPGGLLGAICGGASLPPALEAEADQLGLTVWQGYGLSEAGPVLAVNAGSACRRGSVGKWLDGVEHRINSEGHLWIRGPQLMLGYVDADGKLGGLDADGWFDSGDIVRMDADGFVWLVGRSKTLLVLASGKKVHPEEVENVLSEHPAIADICVLGAASRFSGNDEVVAVVCLRTSEIEWSENVANENVLMDAMNTVLASQKSRLADYKWPSRFILARDTLPRTTSMKLKRKEIAEQYLEKT